MIIFEKKTMKTKLFVGLMGSVLFFYSCSSNDDQTTAPPEKKILLSRVTSDYLGNKTQVKTYDYNSQGELIKITFLRTTILFEYENGNPIKVSEYYNQELTKFTVFKYNGNSVHTQDTDVLSTSSLKNKTYTYNSNGQLINYIDCGYYKCDPPPTNLPDYTYMPDYSYIYEKDNISVQNYKNYNGIFTTTGFIYDNKLNPYTNIHKYLKLMVGGMNALSKNNNIGNSKNNSVSKKIQYNENQLPAYELETQNGSIISQVYYEYITL